VRANSNIKFNLC